MSRGSAKSDFSRADREDLEALAESDLPVSDIARNLLEAIDE